jgi:hypothetical protein
MALRTSSGGKTDPAIYLLDVQKKPPFSGGGLTEHDFYDPSDKKYITIHFVKFGLI